MKMAVQLVIGQDVHKMVKIIFKFAPFFNRINEHFNDTLLEILSLFHIRVVQRYIPLYAEPKTTEIHRGTPRPRFEFRSLTTRVIELFENYEFES